MICQLTRKVGTTMCFCHSIPIFNIVITYFRVPAQKIIKYKKKSKNIIKKYNSEKRMSERPKNGQKLVEEVQNYKD
jgi:hypothetical protein